MESGRLITEMGEDLYTFVQNSKPIPIDIKFQNLSYFIKTGMFAKKQLLNDINGHFYTGELTGILGASGSGKTTLLNILAGYVTKDVKGTIEINGNPRNSKLRRLAAYITQEDLIQPYLTVEEEMMMVAKLKLDPNITLEQKHLIVEKIITLFGLTSCYRTRVEAISGGERKRLSIALELIRDPPLIFIDEPTSGLDSVTLNLVMDVLKELTNKKRTVICTLNQPPVSVLNNFQQLYFIAKGECIYNGTTTNILPFLSSVNLECPLTYSYSEFIIETAELNPSVIPTLVDAVDNGKINKRDELSKSAIVGQIENGLEDTKDDFKRSFWAQFWILLNRMMVQQSRNRVALWVQLFAHVIVGALISLAFFNIGNNAKFVYSNYYLCWLILSFLFYTYVMTVSILFPFELEMIKKEYLNRWYGLNPYYLALSLRTIPIMVILGFGFVLFVYFVTGQPLDVIRFVKFVVSCILLGIIGEGLGLMVGSNFSSLSASAVAPGLISPPTLLAVYGMGFFNQVSPFMKVLCATSFLRQGLISMMLTLFGSNRAPFDCFDELGCQYKYPKQFLKDLGMLDNSYTTQTLLLIGFIMLFRLVAYISIRRRLNSEERFNNSSYLSQVLFKQ